MTWALSHIEKSGSGTSLRASLELVSDKLRAKITVLGGIRCEVTFSHAYEALTSADARVRGRLHARAEAARFLAQSCDTVGDLFAASEDGCACDVTPHPSGMIVSLTGVDSIPVLAPYFGDVVADELLFL